MKTFENQDQALSLEYQPEFIQKAVENMAAPNAVLEDLWKEIGALVLKVVKNYHDDEIFQRSGMDFDLRFGVNILVESYREEGDYKKRTLHLILDIRSDIQDLFLDRLENYNSDLASDFYNDLSAMKSDLGILPQVAV